MALRREEQMAGELFAKWLTETFGLRVTWEAVTPDPPDLRFTIENDEGGEEWAVEVTGLFQYSEWGESEGNIRNVQAPLEQMCERLGDTARESVITGYIISGSGPFDARLKTIEERAREYIQSARTEREYLDFPEVSAEFSHIAAKDPDDERLQASIKAMTEERCRFFIQAVTKPRKISWIAGLDGTTPVPDGSGMIADTMKTLDYSIRRILDAKLPRLKGVTGYNRKLLLVWSGYFFADTERVTEVLSQRDLSVEDIDAIVLIDSSSQVSCVADPGQLLGFPS